MRRYWSQCALLSIYLVATAVAIFHRSMWRDETQAWLIARDSHSFAGLIHNLHYEGHPALWYLLLLPLTRISRDPVLMQALHWVIAAASLVLVLFRAPLTAVERLLLPFGFFFFYEYAVNSRSYAVGSLCVLLFAACWPIRRRHPILLGGILALMANVHALLLIVSVAGFAALALDRHVDRLSARPTLRSDAAACAVLLLGWAASGATVRPPPDSGYLTGWFLHPSVSHLRETVALLSVFVTPSASIIASLPAVLILLIVASRFKNDPPACTFLLLSTGGILAFSYLKSEGFVWHRGLIFIVFVAAIWMNRATTAAARPATSEGVTRSYARRLARPVVPAFLVFLILLVQARAGVKANWAGLHQPNSNGRAVARYIAAHGWRNEPIIGLPDFSVSTIVGYLEIDRAFYLNGQRWGSFTVWDKRRLGAVDATAALAEAIRFGPAETLLIAAGWQVDPAVLVNFHFTRVAQFSGAAVTDENFTMYRRGT